MIFSTSYPPTYSKQIRLLNVDASEIPYQQHVITFRALFHLPTYQVKQQPRFLNHVTINHHQPSSSIINHHQPSSTIVNHAFLVRSNDWWLLIRLIQVGAPNSILIGMTVLKAWSLVRYGGWLLGGFNPLEKYESKWASSPNFRGENSKKYLSCHHLEDDQSDGPIVSAVEILLVFCGAPFGLPCPSKSNVFQWQLEVPGTVQSNRRERDTLWML